MPEAGAGLQRQTIDEIQIGGAESQLPGTGISRRYLYSESEAELAYQPVGTFTPWVV